MNAEQYRTLVNKLEAIEAGSIDEGFGTAIGSTVGSAVQGVKNFVGDIKQGYNQATAQGGMGYTGEPESGMTTTAQTGKADPAVQKLQQDLIAKGAKIKADGIMGPLTQAAQKQFGGATTTPTPTAAAPAKPAVNPEMVKVAQQLAAGTLPQDQAMAQLMKLAGQTKPAGAAQPAAISPKAAAGFKDSDW